MSKKNRQRHKPAREPGSPLLGRARAALAAGRLADAGRLARQALAAAPGDARAMHLLGAVSLREGEPGHALALLGDALAQRPDEPDLLIDHGEALRAGGRFEEAVASCDRAVKMAPDDARGWTALGLACMAAGRREAGVGALRRASELAPRAGDVAMHLANAAHETGDIGLAAEALARAARCKETALPAQLGLGAISLANDDLAPARAAFEAAARLRRGHPRVQLGLAMVAERAGAPAAALELYQSLTRSEPGDEAAWQGVARVALTLRRHEDAVGAAKLLLDAAPADVQRRVQLVRALTAADRLEAAMQACDDGLARGEDARLLTRRGHLLALLGDVEAARDVLQRARRLDDRDAETANLLGETLMQLGDLDTAATQFRAALAISPDNELAWENIGLLPHRFHEAGDIAALRAVVQRPGRGPLARATLHFALAALQDTGGDQDGTCATLDTANDIVNRLFPWDAQAYQRQVEALLQVDAELVCSLAAHGHSADAPLFIVGMPRSGTTLLEQMLGCHPQVHAAGEVLFFGRVRVDAGGVGYPASLPHMDGAMLRDLGERYLAIVTPACGAPARITDKLPDNFLRLPLIAAVFPNARFIHLRRNAEDVCLSLYRQNFAFPEGNAWTYSLAHIAHYHAGFRRVMAHWPGVLGERLMELDYEALVSEPETQLRRVLAHAGLPWDAACLDFTRARRAVATASVAQVREPLHARNVGRAARYGPLLARLRACMNAL